MARCTAPENLKSLFSLRIANIPDSVKTDELIADCKVYGPIGDFYRPTNLHKHTPSPFAFVRYFTQEDADRAKVPSDHEIFRLSFNKSHDTHLQGFITNEAFDIPKVEVKNFEGGMPPSHYEVKRREQLLQVDPVYSVKVSDIPLEVKKEQLEGLFSAHGDVSSVYYPTDLHTLRPRGFAFVRFVREDCAHSAVRELDGHFLCGDRPITVAVVRAAPRYFSQDESTGTADGETRD